MPFLMYSPSGAPVISTRMVIQVSTFSRPVVRYQQKRARAKARKRYCQLGFMSVW